MSKQPVWDEKRRDYVRDVVKKKNCPTCGKELVLSNHGGKSSPKESEKWRCLYCGFSTTSLEKLEE